MKCFSDRILFYFNFINPIFVIYCAVIFVSPVGGASAEEKPAPSPTATTKSSLTSSPKPLTRAEVVRQAIRRSPSLKSAEALLHESGAVTARYKRALFPTVAAKATATSREDSATIGAGSTSTNRSSEDYQAYLEAKQPLYTGGAALGALRLQKKNEDKTYTLWLGEKQLTVYNALDTYFTMQANTELLAAGQENHQILAEYEKVVARYTKIGRARKTDLLQAQVNLLSSDADVKSIESALVFDQQQLRKLLSLEDVPTLDPAQTPREKIVYPDPGLAVKSALETNTTIAQAKLELEKTQYEREVELAQDMPQINLTGKVGYQSPDQPNLFKDSSQANSVSLNLEIPLFSGLTSIAKRRELVERASRRERELERARLEVDGNVRTLIEQLKNNEASQALSQTAAEKARAALVAANKDYQQGLISSQDLVNIQKTHYEARRRFIHTQTDFSKSLLSLRFAMGIDLEATYGKDE